MPKTNRDMQTIQLDFECLKTAMDMSAKVAEAIENGDIQPWEAFAILTKLNKATAKAIGVAKDTLRDYEWGNERELRAYGYVFTPVLSKRSYDFSNIPEWVDLNNEIKALEKAAKSRVPAFEKGDYTCDEDGVILPVPVVRYSKPSISVK